MIKVLDYEIIRNLVFDEQSALCWVREVSSCPLHHQFKDCIGWDIVEVVPP